MSDCRCGQKRDPYAGKVWAICPDCTAALEMADGRFVSAHAMWVLVPERQVSKWRELGYTIDVKPALADN